MYTLQVVFQLPSAVWKNEEELELSLTPRGEVLIRRTARVEDDSSGTEVLLLVKTVRSLTTDEDTKVEAALSPDEDCLAF